MNGIDINQGNKGCRSSPEVVELLRPSLAAGRLDPVHRRPAEHHVPEPGAGRRDAAFADRFDHRPPLVVDDVPWMQRALHAPRAGRLDENVARHEIVLEHLAKEHVVPAIGIDIKAIRETGTGVARAGGGEAVALALGDRGDQGVRQRGLSGGDADPRRDLRR